MNINRRYLCAAACSGMMVLLFQAGSVMAEGQPQANMPVQITFAKWITGVTGTEVFGITEARALMAGVTGGDVPGNFVGEVLRFQPSVNPALKAGILKLEAIYEVHDVNGNHVFTALIRGGTNMTTGAAILDGVVLAGWRTGAPVHVEFGTTTGCAGAPTPATMCFEGTIEVGGAPKGGN